MQKKEKFRIIYYQLLGFLIGLSIGLVAGYILGNIIDEIQFGITIGIVMGVLIGIPLGNKFHIKYISKNTYDKLWEDENNWKIGRQFYYCKIDPRIIVPKKWKALGWSLNFVYPMSYFFLILIPIAIILPFKIEIYFGWASPVLINLSIIIITGLLVVFCALASSRNK